MGHFPRSLPEITERHKVDDATLHQGFYVQTNRPQVAEIAGNA